MNRTTATHALLIALLALGLCQATARAATITVNSTGTLIDNDGECTLREAILAANNNSASGGSAGECGAGAVGSDVIEFDGLPLNAVIDVSVNGLPAVTEALEILAPVGAQIGLQGNDTSPILVSDAELRVENMQLLDGGAYGAAVRMDEPANLTLRNCLIDSHSASNGGGAVVFKGDASGRTLLIEDCVFSNNAVTNGTGGAIDLDASSEGPGQIDATILRSLFINNKSSGNGGAISLRKAIGSVINLSVTDSLFELNQSALRGGAIFNIQEGGVMRIENTTLADNTSEQRGGAIYSSNGTHVVINSTIDGNRAGNEGGGLYLRSFSGEFTAILNSTITRNIANAEDVGGSGGGLFFNSGVLIRNTVLADNQTLNGGAGPDCSGNGNSDDYNFIGDVAGCGLTLAGNDLSGDSGAGGAIDPQLDGLTDNGGPTPTRAPNAGSALIDGGDPTGCSDETGLILNTDQRGEDRFQDGNADGLPRCDIGAFEQSIPDVIYAHDFDD